MCTTARQDVRADAWLGEPVDVGLVPADPAGVGGRRLARVVVAVVWPAPADGGPISLDWTRILAKTELIGAGGLTPARAIRANARAITVAVSPNRARRGRYLGRHPTDLAFAQSRARPS
jgi:hypothetical protein